MTLKEIMKQSLSENIYEIGDDKNIITSYVMEMNDIMSRKDFRRMDFLLNALHEELIKVDYDRNIVSFLTKLYEDFFGKDYGLKKRLLKIQKDNR